MSKFGRTPQHSAERRRPLRWCRSHDTAGSFMCSKTRGTAAVLLVLLAIACGGAEASGFMPGAPLATPRYFHTTTQLSSSKALVAGGSSGASGPVQTPLKSVELYDAATNTWTAAAPLLAVRYSHGAALLAYSCGHGSTACPARPWVVTSSET